MIAKIWHFNCFLLLGEWLHLNPDKARLHEKSCGPLEERRQSHRLKNKPNLRLVGIFISVTLSSQIGGKNES
jgi:hypothetical protein